MSFAENLKQLRKERHISQEELAELLMVSRQAVSKWEQGIGYPEVETLLLLASKLGVSLDRLMAEEITPERPAEQRNAAGTITITSPFEHAIVTCRKVVASGKMNGGKSAPQYALFATGEGVSVWGDVPTTFLGWYANETELAKEIAEIHAAMVRGAANYTLQYNVRTKKRLLSIKIDAE